MEIVNFLAELWGFSLIIICFSLLIVPENIENIFKLAKDGKILVLIGIINVVLGIALVLTYHVFDSSWRIIITLLGWLVVIRGWLILFMPGIIRKIVAKFESNTDLFSIVMVGAILFGCALIYLGLMF